MFAALKANCEEMELCLSMMDCKCRAITVLSLKQLLSVARLLALTLSQENKTSCVTVHRKPGHFIRAHCTVAPVKVLNPSSLLHHTSVHNPALVPCCTTVSNVRHQSYHSGVLRAISDDFKSYFRMHEWRVKHNTKRMLNE